MIVSRVRLGCRRELFSVVTFVFACLISSLPFATDYDFVTIVDSNSGLIADYQSLGQRKINDNGEVPFVAITELDQNRLYKGNGGSLTHIAGPPTIFGLNFTGNGAIDNSGDVVFKGSTESSSNGIYRGSGGAVTTIITGNENPSIEKQLIPPAAARRGRPGNCRE